MTMNCSKTMVNPCSVCDSEKKKAWHLVCPGCWEVLPREIQDELLAAYRENPQSQRHYLAIRAAFTALFVSAEVSGQMVVFMEGTGN